MARKPARDESPESRFSYQSTDETVPLEEGQRLRVPTADELAAGVKPEVVEDDDEED